MTPKELFELRHKFAEVCMLMAPQLQGEFDKMEAVYLKNEEAVKIIGGKAAAEKVIQEADDYAQRVRTQADGILEGAQKLSKQANERMDVATREKDEAKNARADLAAAQGEHAQLVAIHDAKMVSEKAAASARAKQLEERAGAIEARAMELDRQQRELDQTKRKLRELAT